MNNKKKLLLLELGFRDYQFTLDLQRRLCELRTNDNISDILLLVEHDHVITCGKSAGKQDLLLTEDEQLTLGIPVYRVERGGEYTYHGPGQLIGYPVIKLEDEYRHLSWYIAQLEEVIIKTLGEFMISSGRRAGFPGVWVNDKKIASIGIAVKRWVSYHGFSINVNTCLENFQYINPCGQDWTIMTSMAQLRGNKMEMRRVIDVLVQKFTETFSMEIESIDYEHICETTLVGSEIGLSV